MTNKTHLDRKTLVLSEIFPPVSGGSGRWLWELYSRLDASKLVVVTDQASDLKTADFDSKASLEIIRLPLRSVEWGIASKVGFLFYLKSFFRLKRIIKKYKIEEIHCSRVIHEGVLAWFLSFVCRVDLVVFVHGEDVESAATSREHDLLVKQVCKKAKLLICNSENTANIVKRLRYDKYTQSIVLNPGVDCRYFVPTAKNSDFLANQGWQDRLVLLTVGRLQKRKGHDMLIESLPDLIKKFPNLLYVIVGSGEELPHLLSLVIKLNVQKHVQILEDADDKMLLQCYQQCDWFILPNRTIDNDIEGFGMVLVEAQSCGKPVIAGNSGGTKETMIQGVTGFIIDCSNSKLITDSLSELLESQTDYENIGLKGREHVLSTLDWDVHTQKALFHFNRK